MGNRVLLGAIALLASGCFFSPAYNNHRRKLGEAQRRAQLARVEYCADNPAACVCSNGNPSKAGYVAAGLVGYAAGRNRDDTSYRCTTYGGVTDCEPR